MVRAPQLIGKVSAGVGRGRRCTGAMEITKIGVETALPAFLVLH
ncbi:hypothetical protein U128_00305 [Anaplasma marginale str. Gypsy Plains]|nr:hypothetical protein U128_00305 [Anaplasma marginale str. Gypsy Plains]